MMMMMMTVDIDGPVAVFPLVVACAFS